MTRQTQLIKDLRDQPTSGNCKSTVAQKNVQRTADNVMFVFTL